MKKNLKKIIAVLAVGGTFFGYVFSQKASSSSSMVAADNITSNNSQSIKTATTIPAPKPVAVVTSKPTVNPKPIGAFKDGAYTGIVADAYYGNMQVQAIVQNGALVDVAFLQYPSDRNTSIRINSMAMPRLKSEAIQAQSANVNTVSGASASSQAFVQSLQSALDQAKV